MIMIAAFRPPDHESQLDETQPSTTRILSRRDQVIGEALAAARLNEGLSEERLAILIGITPRELKDSEGGFRRLWVNEIFAASFILKVEPSTFLPRLLVVQSDPRDHDE